MGSNFSELKKKSLVLIFAYAPHGFGHLRVTDALYNGLPRDISPLLLGSNNDSLTFFYRFMSIHPFARRVMEGFQRGIFENLFTIFYRWFLNATKKSLYRQMLTILDERIEVPETMVVVATHFGLAHQLAFLKDKLEQEKKVKIVLVVQVTDDSPQHLWYVPKADIIFVPSVKTRNKLIEYGKEKNLPSVNIEAIPYPLNPVISKTLPNHKFIEKLNEVSVTENSKIHVVIPVSGAAVGMQFFISLIDEINKSSNDFIYHIICKSAIYTQLYLNEFLKRFGTKLYVSSFDRSVIDQYENVYHDNIIAIEITKPSEQAFKTLLNPTQIGGALLLFTMPVGRQEYDNLDFLRSHHLIPHPQEEKNLWLHAEKDSAPSDSEIEKAKHWRGISLPEDPKKAANFIVWCLKKGIFSEMMHYKRPAGQDPSTIHEISSLGVKIFWEKVENYLTKNG